MRRRSICWAALALAAGLLTGCSQNLTAATPAPEPAGRSSTGELQFVLYGNDGNDSAYDLKKVQPMAESPLNGKTILWLGSSVTYGAGSNGQALPQFMAAADGAVSVTEAMSGTTLATIPGQEEKSYISRMLNSKKFPEEDSVDFFICQISTNDCKQENLPLWGELTTSDVTDPEQFDLGTTMGAVEYLIRYVHDSWDCPVIFYSGSYFGNAGDGIRGSDDPRGSDYGRLVDLVRQAADKWNAQPGYQVEVLDLFHDEAFNSQVSDSDYQYLMRDPVHPRKAGYLVWWLPQFQKLLYPYCSL